MRSCKWFAIILAALFIAVTTLSADPLIVTVTFIGAGPLGGAAPVNDGTDYVLPYTLSIGGVTLDADCYDYLHNVHNGETWQASELTLSEAAAAGSQFGGQTDSLTDYEDVAWLSSQLTPASTPQNQIDLQHVIWNIFDPGQFTVTNGMISYMDALSEAQSGFSVSDFDSYLFVQAIPVEGTSLAQAFVIDTEITTNNAQNPGTPEPGTWMLMSVALGLTVISKTVAERRSKRLACETVNRC